LIKVTTGETLNARTRYKNAVLPYALK